jgi:hypothetical protein
MSTIISTKILAQWSDKDKLVKIQQDMPSDLQELFDNWLSDIETEKKENERLDHPQTYEKWLSEFPF